LITQGVSQGLSLLTGLLARPGDVVAVEQPVYLGLLHVLNTHGVTPVGIPLDNEGICLEALEQAIQTHHPRFVYTIPSFQNPTGTTISPQRRDGLLALARRYKLPIVEDDIYGLLAYDDAPPLPLKAFDTSDQVIYLSSMSKTLMPGLRMGYMVVPEQFREPIVLHRVAHDITSPTLLQRALANFLHRGRFKAHIERAIPHYRARRDELLNALAQKMPASACWTRPAGGFCCWLTLPRVPADFHQRALRQGMAFTPGDVFLVQPDENTHVRLCFSGLSPDLIREAITILGRLVEETTLTSPRVRGLPHALPLV
jgi:DNA-binding transcriptional MocR family regulator